MKGKNRYKPKRRRQSRLALIIFAATGAIISGMFLYIIGFAGISFMLPGVSGCSEISPEGGRVVSWMGNFIPVSSESKEQWEKGYDLPIEEQERKEAEKDCRKVMELAGDIYREADKGEASDTVLSDETVLKIQNKVQETGCPVHAAVWYSDMKNFEKMENFLNACMDGKTGSIVVYEIHSSGSIGRMKYRFDGTDLYVFSANTIWNEENGPVITSISCNRIKEWRYSDKGWFCYKLCVPEYPEVTEVIDGSCMVRVRPMTEGQRAMSEKCVLGLGYQGNNLLCSNWDAEHLDKLDYNGMFEYLYAIKYGKRFVPETYPDGIPEEEFESLIMEYLPVTVEQIQKYAAFDEKNRTYVWVRLGCSNYAPTAFGTSLPEVTDIEEKEGGIVILTVEAVCSKGICDDAVITHELTVRFNKDGSFQYQGNKILNDGIQNIPEYQYRINVTIHGLGGRS